MKILKEVKVGGIVYKVNEEKHLMRDEGRMGQQCGNVQEIKLDSEMSDQMRKSTFIHEVLHALSFVYDIGLEEKQVAQLEAGLFALICDNPEMFKGK